MQENLFGNSIKIIDPNLYIDLGHNYLGDV